VQLGLDTSWLIPGYTDRQSRVPSRA
jgi:hypothetical protein